jgi:hypothetical protein
MQFGSTGKFERRGRKNLRGEGFEKTIDQTNIAKLRHTPIKVMNHDVIQFYANRISKV